MRQTSCGVSCRKKRTNARSGLPWISRRAKSWPFMLATAAKPVPSNSGPGFPQCIVSARHSIPIATRLTPVCFLLPSIRLSLRVPVKRIILNDSTIHCTATADLTAGAQHVGILQETGESYRRHPLFHLPLQSRKSGITCITLAERGGGRWICPEFLIYEIFEKDSPDGGIACKCTGYTASRAQPMRPKRHFP